MSVENVKKFKKDLEENAKLKEKVEKELEFINVDRKERELIPLIARKLGYDFTDEEFEEESKTLSDEELTCIFMWYHHGWQSYYWINNICENCHSKNGSKAGNRSPFICNDCGHYTENPENDSGLE